MILPKNDIEINKISDNIFKLPYKTIKPKDVYDLFGPKYIPGTFHVCERKHEPNFIFETEIKDYDQWIHSIVKNQIFAINNHLKIDQLLEADTLFNFQKSVLTVLDTQYLKTQSKVCECITNQQISDIILRILKSIIFGDCFATCHFYKDFNFLGKILAFQLLRKIRIDDPIMRLKIAIASGSIGINLKDKDIIAGPSPVVSSKTIDIPSNIEDVNINSVLQQVLEKAEKEYAIDFCDYFVQDILKSECHIRILFFTDDYIETIFDLWMIQSVLELNENIEIYIVPKWGQYFNDASYEDIIDLIHNPLFGRLKVFMGHTFFIQKYGPAGSGINPFEFSEQVFELLKGADFAIIKGARAFEMLQGIRKNTYFGFNVLREYTETITGIPAEQGQQVLIKQNATHSFIDFKYRGTRKIALPSGRTVGFAKLTVLDHINEINNFNN